jgi:hypothetical protein
MQIRIPLCLTRWCGKAADALTQCLPPPTPVFAGYPRLTWTDVGVAVYGGLMSLFAVWFYGTWWALAYAGGGFALAATWYGMEDKDGA